MNIDSLGYTGYRGLTVSGYDVIGWQMTAVVEELGPLETAAELTLGGVTQSHVATVLRRWEHLMVFDLFHQHRDAVDGRR